jgi:four helix bundle protein
MGNFKDLKAWQYARRLAVLSKGFIIRLPESEKDGLADQWRRASYSVVLNIAEGAAKKGPREFRRYLDSARASLHEIEAILDLVVALGYLRPEQIAALEATRAECARTVYGLLRKMDTPPKRS